jgi:hypothetical protein
MSDLASWQCFCGTRITAGQVVDPRWWRGVENHRAECPVWAVYIKGRQDALREHSE